MNAKTIWNIAPYLKSEGSYFGTVIRLRRMSQADGCQIMLRLDGTQALSKMPASKTKLPESLARLIYQEEADAAGSVKIGLYFSNWKYTDDTDGESDIEDLLTHIRPGDHITFRMSKNWRGKKYYCRYIKNDDTEEWSGWEHESDWRQASHPYPSYRKSGTAIFTIIHVEYVTDDFGHGMYSLEVSENTSEHFGTYRCLVPSGTDAYRTIQTMENTDYQNRKFFCTVFFDEETKKSYIEKLEPVGRGFTLSETGKPKTPGRKRGRKKIDVAKYDYASMKKIADGFPKIPNSEYGKTGGLYQVTIITNEAVDYRRCGSISFIPLRLQDGREIMPSWQSQQRIREKRATSEMRQTEIENGKIENPEPGGSKVINRKSENSKAPNSEFEKSKDGNGEWEIADAGNRENGNGDTAKSKTDLLKNRRLLFPGLTVMAYFTPGHKGGYMMLREMWVKVDEGTLERCKEQWLMESEKPSSAPLPE